METVAELANLRSEEKKQVVYALVENIQESVRGSLQSVVVTDH